MKVLVTGAGGTLGTELAPRLEHSGYEPVLFDLKPLESPYRSINGDIRLLDDARKVMSGIDLVVHTAAIHGIHLRDHTPSEFYELNLTGTFNVWEAALEARVRGMVFSSTMGVYGGWGAHRATERRAVAFHEDVERRPVDVYAYTKVCGEEMCRLHVRRDGIAAVALRYGMFVPEPLFREGIRFLYGGVDKRDVAAAVVAALDALAAGRLEWDAFNVMAPMPFTDGDAKRLVGDPLAVVDHYWPGSRDLLLERGIQALTPIREWFPMRRIEERLGFSPQDSFQRWLDELRSRPTERAEMSPPWP